MLCVKQEGIRYHFLSSWCDLTGIEPRSFWPLANTLTIMLMGWWVLIKTWFTVMPVFIDGVKSGTDTFMSRKKINKKTRTKPNQTKTKPKLKTHDVERKKEKFELAVVSTDRLRWQLWLHHWAVDCYWLYSTDERQRSSRGKQCHLLRVPRTSAEIKGDKHLIQIYSI